MQANGRRWIVVIAVVGLALALLVILASVGIMLGSDGLLPWQPEPTRISITPFADLPGSGAATPAP